LGLLIPPHAGNPGKRLLGKLPELAARRKRGLQTAALFAIIHISSEALPLGPQARHGLPHRLAVHLRAALRKAVAQAPGQKDFGGHVRVNQAFRFELSPNKGQRKALAQHVGAARFAYNWGLKMALKARAEGRRLPSAPELHKAWNAWKRENAPWWTEVSKCAPQEAFRDLERALRNWQKRKGRFPRFKRKKLAPDNGARFTGAIKVFSRHIQLPRIGRCGARSPQTNS